MASDRMAGSAMSGSTAVSSRFVPSPPTGGRLSDVLAGMSTILDVAERRTAGHAVRAAWIMGRLAGELALADARRTDAVLAGLLVDAGTIGPHAAPADGDTSRRSSTQRERGTERRPLHLTRPARARATAATLELPAHIGQALADADERWDGRGPAGTRRERISQDGRMLALASLVAGLGAAPAAGDIERALRAERSKALDPGLVDAVLRIGKGGLWTELADPDLAASLGTLEAPATIRWIHDGRLDSVAVAFADIVDTRTPRMGRHGRRVAGFAVRTGRELGLDPALLVDLRRAAMLHDVGKLLVPIASLEKPAELTDEERRVVDEHARTSAATLARTRVFASLAPLVVAHHERLDGNGMFPAMPDPSVAMAARVLALSDRYEAMTAERPYRPLLSPTQVWSILDEVVGEPTARAALRALRRAVVDAP